MPPDLNIVLGGGCEPLYLASRQEVPWLAGGGQETRRSQLPTHKVLHPQGRENKTRLSGTTPLLPWKQDGKGDLRLEQGSHREWGLHDFGLGSGFQHIAPLKRNTQDHPCITMDASARAESQAQTGNHIR